MLRTILICLATALASASFGAPADSLRTALEARAAGDWARARQLARAAGPVGRDVIEWHYLRAGQGRFAEAQDFLKRRPDWPGLPYLRTRSEQTIPQRADARQVVSYFSDQAPRTGVGSLRYAAALAALGQADAARAEAVRGWITHSLTADQEAAYMAKHGRALAQYHWQRTDMLLWRGLTQEARRMMPRVSQDRQKLANARIALRENEGFDAALAAVPAGLRSDPGLAYERFRWRSNRGRTDGAVELMEQTRDLGQPERWSNLRRRYVRQLMRDGQGQRAYRLAARHGLTEGSDYADLEWLAGYIALRKLGDAKTALTHFARHEQAVATPISVARSTYWQARAHEVAGDQAAAVQDYQRAAQNQTAFYGLLAAEKLGWELDPKLIGREVFPDWRSAAYTQSSVYEAAILLLAAGDLNLSERFLTHLAESLDRTQIGQMGEMARDLGQPHLEVMIAKRAVQYGMVVERPYYALHPLAQDTGSLPPELPLSIARRESEFDPAVVSGVGALGLMQVMPPTAREMAGVLNEAYSRPRMTGDAAYNARLGLAYLRALRSEFGYSPIQISVAYNAGPSRAHNWVSRFGNPRSADVDIVDWIEHIPFRETRNYVMRVAEALPIYRARLTGRTEPVRLTQELRGRAPTASDRAALAERPTPISTERVQSVSTTRTTDGVAAAGTLTQSLRPRARVSASGSVAPAPLRLAPTGLPSSLRPRLRP